MFVAGSTLDTLSPKARVCVGLWRMGAAVLEAMTNQKFDYDARTADQVAMRRVLWAWLVVERRIGVTYVSEASVVVPESRRFSPGNISISVSAVKSVLDNPASDYRMFKLYAAFRDRMRRHNEILVAHCVDIGYSIMDRELHLSFSAAGISGCEDFVVKVPISFRCGNVEDEAIARAREFAVKECLDRGCVMDVRSLDYQLSRL